MVNGKQFIVVAVGAAGHPVSWLRWRPVKRTAFGAVQMLNGVIPASMGLYL